jgi:hypothetical protein
MQAKSPIATQKPVQVFGATAPRVFGRRMQPYKGPGDQEVAHDSDGIDGELSFAMAASRRTEFRRISRLIKVCCSSVAYSCILHTGLVSF